MGPNKGGCPCVNGHPCESDCTCVQQFSSRGCRYCAKYGSKAQRLAAAVHISNAIDWYETYGPKTPQSDRSAE